jgi:oligogalacturonide transport system substrate-binding protein
MNMWRKLLLAVTLVASMALNTSCDSSSKRISSYDPDEECTITISWWGGDDRHQATEQAIELFESKYPNIHVETEYGSWSGWKNQIFDELDTGTCTDVIQVNYDWLVTLSYDGTGFFDLEKLSDYIDLSNFSDDILQFGRRNGILNAIPVSITGRTLFYNQDIFNKAGATLPTTWQDLFDVAPKLNAIGSYPLNLDNNTGFTGWYLAVVYEQQKTGKDFITSDGEIGFSVDDITDALQFYKDLQDNGVIRGISQISEEDTSSSLYECDTWLNGEVAGILEWGSSVSKYQTVLENQDSLVLGDLITTDGSENTGWYYKPSLLFAINKDTEYPVQSAMLLNFLYNDPDGVEILGTTRGIPVSETALQTLSDLGTLDGLAYQSNEQILSSDPILISPYMENSDMQTYYNDAIEAVSLELLTPEEASQGLYANIVYALDSLKEGN